MIARIISFLFLLVSAAPANAADVTVEPGHNNLMRAIASADAGDTLLLGRGTYDGNVVVDKSIAIRGDGSAAVAGDGTGTVVTVGRAGCNDFRPGSNRFRLQSRNAGFGHQAHQEGHERAR